MRILFILFTFLLPYHEALSQKLASTLEIPAELFGVNQGLSQGFVSSIIQDKEGFVWFATNDGLNKYDGYKVTVYRNNPNDPFSLPDNMISGIVEDEHENFWVAIRAKGMYLFDKRTERFFPIPFPNVKAEGGIHDMKYSKGRMYLNTFNNVFLFEMPPIKIALPYNANQVNISTSFNFRYQDSISSLNSDPSPTTRVFWMKDKIFWVSNVDTIVRFKYNESSRTWNAIGFKPIDLGIPYRKDELIYLSQNPKNEHELIAVGHGVITITDIKSKQRIFQKSFGEIASTPSMMDDGMMFISASDGLQYRLDVSERELKPSYFKNVDFKFAIISAYIDANGVRWFATNGYGVIISDNKKSNFDTKDVRYYRNIFFTEDTPRIHRFSSELEELTKRYFTFNSITEDTSGNYWLFLKTASLPMSRLFFYNTTTKKVKRFPTTNTMISHTFIYNDKQDRLWIFGDYGRNNCLIKQMNKEDGTELKQYRVPTGNFLREIEFIRSIHSDDRGVLFLATDMGLFRFEPEAPDSAKQWRKYQHNDNDSMSLAANSLWCVCPDPMEPKRYLWIGYTSKGFSRLEIATGKCIHYSEKDGLPNNVVYGILSDKFNNLWLSTNKGLSCFSPSTKSFLNFVAEDGLQGDEFNHLEFKKLKTGELYFGGVSGYTIFKPEVVLQKQKEISLAFTELSIANKVIDWKANPTILPAPIAYAKYILFHPKQNMFTISFATLEYRSNKKKFYKYKLLGFHNEWTEPSTKNEATFSNLPPGTYTLQVTGTNTDGVWNTKGISIEIRVLPDWYQTWWFRLSVGLIVFGLLYAFYRYRLNQHTKLLVMRNNIASDLHDEIGSSLSTIAIFSESVRRIISNNPKADQVLSKISDSATEVMETMSDIVWTINSKNDTADNLINRIRIYAVELSESTPFELHMDSNNNIPNFKLDMKQRKQVYLIFKEAINNSAKYARCKNVWIDFKLQQGILTMTIKDDGKGFDLTEKNNQNFLGGNGLINMQHRAKEINGTLEVRSAPNQGTSIRLTFRI